jgi:nucleotide-binding universal stress UspA family protein
VVVGCDGSPEGSDAAVFGTALRALHEGGLTLAGVYTNPLFPVPESMGSRAQKAETEVMLRRERDLRAPGAQIVVEGDLSVPRALRRIARRDHADLVVLGSASHAPAGRTEPGPHARQLLHNAPCAAAVVPRGYREKAGSLARIAVGYDGGNEAKRALEIATELARQGGGQVQIHEVVDDRIPIGLNIVVDAITGHVIDWEALMDEARAKAQRRVDEVAAGLSVPGEATVTVGDPGLELRKLTDQVDLIVLGSLRLARNERLGIGATAERVLDGAACPVLLVPR